MRAKTLTILRRQACLNLPKRVNSTTKSSISEESTSRIMESRCSSLLTISTLLGSCLTTPSTSSSLLGTSSLRATSQLFKPHSSTATSRRRTSPSSIQTWASQSSSSSSRTLVEEASQPSMRSSSRESARRSLSSLQAASSSPCTSKRIGS